MRKILLTTLLSAAVAFPSAAAAQEKATRSVDDYLCTFAGKCGDDSGEEVTKDAPETKGFSLTRPGGAKAAAKPSAKAPSPKTHSSASAQPARQMSAPKAQPAKQALAAKTTKPMKQASAPAARRGDLSLSFELGSAVLTAEARDNARAFAEALKRPELASKRVMIEGHTDRQGSREFNLDLSQRRAKAVADYLQSLGVSADRLEVKGFGFDRPRSGSASENRRVEAVLAS